MTILSMHRFSSAQHRRRLLIATEAVDQAEASFVITNRLRVEGFRILGLRVSGFGFSGLGGLVVRIRF